MFSLVLPEGRGLQLDYVAFIPFIDRTLYRVHSMSGLGTCI